MQDPDNTIDQSSDFPMISQPSNLAGPVTYIKPCQTFPHTMLQNPLGPINFEWTPTLGADEYMLEVFPVTDPGGTGAPVFRRTGIRSTSSGNVILPWTPASGDLQVDSVYFWRVGARNSLEATDRPKGQGIPRVGLGQSAIRGYVLSRMLSFQTVPIIPPPPLTRKGGRMTLPVGPGSGLGGGTPTAPPQRNPRRNHRGGSGRPQRDISPQPVGPRPTRERDAGRTSALGGAEESRGRSR
jgi:hypothetical protein